MIVRIPVKHKSNGIFCLQSSYNEPAVALRCSARSRCPRRPRRCWTPRRRWPCPSSSASARSTTPLADPAKRFTGTGPSNRHCEMKGGIKCKKTMVCICFGWFHMRPNCTWHTESKTYLVFYLISWFIIFQDMDFITHHNTFRCGPTLWRFAFSTQFLF